MRAAILLCFMLAACSKEPTFEEQFEKEAAKIEAEAKKLERDLNDQIELVPEAKEAEKLEMPANEAAE